MHAFIFTENRLKQLCESISLFIGNVVFLHGPLGAGKTFVVSALLKSLGHEGSTKSPTYTLVEPYDIRGRKV